MEFLQVTLYNMGHYMDCSILLAGFKSISEIEYLVSKLAKF